MANLSALSARRAVEQVEELTKSMFRLVNCEELADYEWIKLKTDPEIFSGNIIKRM